MPSYSVSIPIHQCSFNLTRFQRTSPLISSKQKNVTSFFSSFRSSPTILADSEKRILQSCPSVLYCQAGLIFPALNSENSFIRFLRKDGIQSKSFEGKKQGVGRAKMGKMEWNEFVTARRNRGEPVSPSRGLWLYG